MATAERLVEEQGLVTEDSAIRYLEQLGYVVIKECQDSYRTYKCDLPVGHEGAHHSQGKSAKMWWR